MDEILNYCKACGGAGVTERYYSEFDCDNYQCTKCGGTGEEDNDD